MNWTRRLELEHTIDRLANDLDGASYTFEVEPTTENREQMMEIQDRIKRLRLQLKELGGSVGRADND